jgi:DNA-binding beta-propeller fold protein YncE
MKAHYRICCSGALLIVAALWAMGASASSTDGEYGVVEKISGGGGAWDYAVIDEQTSRLYLAQQGVTVLDLKTGTLTNGLLKGQMTHGLAPLGDGSVAVDDAVTKTITIFDGATGTILATIPTAQENPGTGMHALDALVLEPRTGLLIAVNGESGLLILVDPKRASVVGTVVIGGRPEYVAVGSAGKVYVNAEKDEAAEIVVVDVALRKVVAHLPLRGCEGPTGIAYDHGRDLLMSVCENGVVKFIRAGSAQGVATLAVGKGADAILFDPHRQRAFVPSAEAGTLSVIAIRSPTDISVVQTVSTQRGTRLGAVDSATGKIYLPAAKFGPPKAPSPYPSVISGTFEIWVVAPR